MLLAHAVTLAEARSYVAALADTAHTYEASAAYESVLIELDALYNGVAPPTTMRSLGTDQSVLIGVAEAAIEELVEHGVDPLQVELVLARLHEARELDQA